MERTEDRWQPRLPLTVASGVLSQREFESVPENVRQALEESSRKLLARYGREFLFRGRARFRYELQDFWGVTLDDPEIHDS